MNMAKPEGKQSKTHIRLKRVSLTIRGKMILSFVSIIVLLIAVSSVGFYGLTLSRQASEEVSKAQQADLMWCSWSSHILRMITNYQYYVITADEKMRVNGEGQWLLAKADETALRNHLGQTQNSSIDTIAAQAVLVRSRLVEAADLYHSGLADDSSDTNTSFVVNHTIDSMMNLINITLAESQKESAAKVNANDRLHYSLSLILIMLAAVAVLITVCITVLIPRNISRSIKAINRVMKRISTGDLTANLPKQINSTGTDEIGTMARSYNEMQKYLLNLVANIKENATQLASASDQLAFAAKQSSESTQQVATSAQQMAKGAQEQSNNAQDTAKSIEQLSGVISQLAEGARNQSSSVKKAIYSISEVSETMSVVAQNAAQAAKGAKQAADSAATGAEKSGLTLSGMEKIKSSTAEVARKIEELGIRSAEIGQIVAVIDGIAAQTNLLALNAAIEAARAGDQGRGFAVVSDEVRKLAERSANATKEIAVLIASIQKGVNEATQVTISGSNAVSHGYNMAMEAGQSLQQILKAASDVNTQVESISDKAQKVNSATNELVSVIDSVGAITEENSTATEHMAANAAEVSKSVETVAGIAEQNSAATEEVSASAEEMSAQVEEIVASAQTLKDMAAALEQSVAMFKIKSDTETEKTTARKK